MTVFDVLIIYLAIGSAFAAWRMTRRKLALTNITGKIAFTFAFWPVTLVRLITLRVANSDKSVKEFAIDHQSDAENAAERIVGVVPIQIGDPRFYEFRESIERYVGLGEALRQDSDISIKGLLQIEQSTPSSVQLRVHARNNRRKLISHFKHAGDEIFASTAEILDTRPDSSVFVEEMLRLFASFSDKENARKLESLRHVSDGGNAATMEVTGWIPQKET